MYSFGLGEVFALVALAWLGVLSFLFWKQWGFLKQLFPLGEQRDIRNQFKEVLVVLEEAQKKDQQVNKYLNGLAKEGLRHTQRLELLRYNPYGDTGGDQSCFIAILDGKGTGFVITSLHTRTGTRVYAKPISLGKSDLRLSKEEEEVVLKALA